MMAMTGPFPCLTLQTMTKKQQYTIRELEWEDIEEEYYVAVGIKPHVEYRVFSQDPKNALVPGTNWFWGFVEGAIYPCDSIEDGKAKAQEHYNKLMEQGLEPIEDNSEHLKAESMMTSIKNDEEDEGPKADEDHGCKFCSHLSVCVCEY